KCNVVFVSGSANDQIGQLSSVIGDRPILIIGDEQKLVKGGADIGLYLEKGKLQFIYSESSIASKGLIISSQLMNLGKSLQ
ncbi:MAG: YfiR family protein, partial [Bacteroidota bacterium]